MGRTLKKVTSLLLIVVMVFSAAPLSGFVGLELPEIILFTTKANAATDGYYTYSVSNGEATITDVYTSISGDITIPSTLSGYPVTSIGKYAFNYCDSLISVTIPDSVTSIGESAFFSCDSLINITIPDSVTSIGDEAFQYCYSLAIITVDSANTAYSNDEYGALFNKNKTELIQYPVGNTRTSYTIPDSVTIIGDCAFENSYFITNITISDSVTSIGYSAFKNCDSLTSITIPESVTSIGGSAFNNCQNLTNIIIPDSVTTIGQNAFLNTGYYENTNNWENENELLYIGNHLVNCGWNISGSYEIKSGTKTIADSVFENCGNLKSITIPDSVTSIGTRAFYSCSSLVSISITDNITNIGNNAFTATGYYNNPNNWDEYVLYIGRYLINANSKLSGSYKIRDDTLLIAGDALSYCYLTSITVDKSNENYSSDEYGVLFNKDKTELIRYPSENTRTSYAILDSVTIIGDRAFYGCDSLTSVTIPDSVTTIGSYVFSECDNLERATIGNGVKSISYQAFYHCRRLTSVTIGNSVTSIDCQAFDYCDSLTSVTIPNSVMIIDDSAFDSYSGNLTDVYYSGAEEQWKKIYIGDNNGPIRNAIIHFNSIGDSTEEPDDTEKYKNATITLDQSCYTVKEPNSLTIEGTITSPDGVDGLLMSWSFDKIDVFYTASQTTYETISETEKRFSQTFTPKEAGQFKIYARLPNGAKAECTVTSYQEAVSAFISEHYQFVKSDKYNDFVAEEYAQELAESMRNNSSYHWNNFVSINFFENYYDLVLAELLTNDTTKQSVKEEIEKIFSSEYVDLTNKLFDFINTTYQDSLGPISEADFYLVFNADTPKVYEDTAIYKALTKGLEDKTLFNNVFEINELFGYAQKIADAKECAVEGIVDCVYYFAAINAYRKADEEIKAVITKAAAKTNNSDLKESLESFASIDSENDYLGFAESLFDKFIDVGRKTAVKICFNSFDFERTLKYILNIKLKDGTKLADKVVKVVTKNGTTVGTIAQYANAVFAGVSLGMAVSELITNADDYSFYASKCTHAGDLAEVLLNVLNESAIDFQENKTLENAHFFDVAFNFYKDTQIYALNAMVESIYAQNSSAVAVIINKAKSASGYISTINRYKNLNCHKHDLTELINAEYYYVDEKYSGNKLIRVACPVDVYVYDSEGNLALSIENDFVEIFDDRLDAFVLNSEKYICVPLDEEFTIKIVSTDDGEMDYSVFEFDENSEMTREVSKENISLVNEKTFEGKIDNIINTAVDNYSLIVTDTQENIAIDNDVDCVPATNISISKSFVELKVGQSQGLVASISPINTTDKYVWISSDETVATVSENGTVNAIGEGNATIVAMVNDLIYAECEVNVVILKDYTISWVVDGVTTSQTVTEGDVIVNPTNPTKTDYAFIGWTPAVPDIMPSYDLTFTAVFEKSYICPDCGDEILGEDTINNHIASESRMKAIVKIKNNSGSKTINYGETLRLTAVTTEMPTDVKIYWYVDGVKKDEGETFNVSFESGTKTVEVKLVDSNNNVLKNASGNEISDSESVTVKGGFFQKLISFFKNLFGVNRTVVQAFKVIL